MEGRSSTPLVLAPLQWYKLKTTPSKLITKEHRRRRVI